MWPGLPSGRRGGPIIEMSIDEECQARLVTLNGQPYGCWLDDSTPDLDGWVSKAVAKYEPLGQPVFVCIPPGRPRLRHEPEPPIVNVYEAYWYGMGCKPSAWLPLPKYDAYCVQHAYPGTHGKKPPTLIERARLMAAVLEHHPKYVFLF